MKLPNGFKYDMLKHIFNDNAIDDPCACPRCGSNGVFVNDFREGLTARHVDWQCPLCELAYSSCVIDGEIMSVTDSDTDTTIGRSDMPGIDVFVYIAAESGMNVNWVAHSLTEDEYYACADKLRREVTELVHRRGCHPAELSTYRAQEIVEGDTPPEWSRARLVMWGEAFDAYIRVVPLGDDALWAESVEQANKESADVTTYYAARTDFGEQAGGLYI